MTEKNVPIYGHLTKNSGRKHEPNVSTKMGKLSTSIDRTIGKPHVIFCTVYNSKVVVVPGFLGLKLTKFRV